jgi:hypothetical protein
MIVALIDESDLHKWTITMDGPPGSPYAVRENISKTFVACKLSVTSHPSQRSQNILAQPLAVPRREILQNSPGQARLSTLDDFPPSF